MKIISGLILALAIFLLSFVSYTQSVFAEEIKASQVSQVTPESNEKKIKQLQTLMQELGLYYGEIDGDYDAIRKILIDYQIKKNIIQSQESWGAGYFGKKTIVALKEDFPVQFNTYADAMLLTEPELWERKFIVTAYYSPLPGQSRYTTGSYVWDIRLNWGGVVTASWNGVFPWILAAPKNYSFGTKIYFEWIWVGVVEDRWWAILNAWERWYEHDRIDIWMWYGDEWLLRALKWWKRTITWKIVEDDIEINIEFSESPVQKYLDFKAGPESEIDDIKKLQELLRQIGVYIGDIDGDYSQIQNAFIAFQIQNEIISSRSDPWAWYFGPKTIAYLRKKYTPNGVFKEKTSYITEIHLSLSQKRQILSIYRKLDAALEKKSEWSKKKKNNYYDQIITRLENSEKKTKSDMKKSQIKYLKQLIKKG